MQTVDVQAGKTTMVDFIYAEAEAGGRRCGAWWPFQLVES
jgi:hypothetical protein